ncbi:phosphate ABC transporter permease subunit PstC [Cryobacterium sp. TMT1-62]|uniref:Phosphate transport system permease protein n=1 Tax=Cryobacterium sandaracinum TaxID=1259247 RepID=A0ABY2JDZ0_9MICO|nr:MULTISPECIES: phosphate ABC transporter permease subunit PstC [Cryobacterium]TFB60151.1 phosphate ABC transporter permease subunit PstC [Cryobacterium sp. Sr3]TFB66081.1 phosphate ABC transporter permease subunit PstC [Cryobacterium sp. Hz7]TFC39706.1 phosphate ABC transporter permease subunit PstC [Cryobacterium sp. TMT2-14]TFC55371.1 phosphate ABC transporter permease subunit PstC [Cryobacterium sp. TMT2-17-1]TFC67585.1 phosphate ABC transporter permease subunit PstC [Cryobacterium sp. TM
MTTAVERPSLKAKERPGDRIFATSTIVAGSLILAILAAVAAFLLVQSLPAFLADPEEFKGDTTNFWSYVWPLAFGTLWAAFLALIMAVPVAIGIALFISHYAPRKLAQGLGYLIDLLAAVPSVVFGLWGIGVLAPLVQPFYTNLVEWFGWIPLFAGPVSGTGRTTLTVAIVLAVMVLPIITALSREIFLQTPVLYEEASLALGATRWEMIAMAVLPFGRAGIISASMLGLGRALGETMAVAMVLSPSRDVIFQLLTSQNPTTIAANIALNFPEAHGVGVNILLATGLILFVITLVVNMIARVIINRRKAFSGAN